LILSSNVGCVRTEVPAAPALARVEVDLATAVARAAKEGRPLFVHFTAEWCLPCEELRETVYPAPAVARRLERFVRAEIDVESLEGEKTARRYGVQTVPVLMTMTPQGEELRSLRVVGARTPSELAVVLDKALEQSGLDVKKLAEGDR
jgi:thiol:disulfide interchange protein DsbD